MPVSHEFSAGKFAVEIEGTFAGFVAAVEGGDAVGIVTDEPATTSGLVKKHIGGIRYEPIKIAAGSGMSSSFYSWVAQMLAGTQSPRDGAIVFYDFQLNEVNRLAWRSGFITEVTFPALDASSRDAAMFTFTISPESAEYKQSSGKDKAKLSSKKHKAIPASNFTLNVKGLENACKRVSKIDALTIKESARDPQDRLTQPALHVSNLVMALAMTDAQPWLDWLTDFLITGNNADEFERHGSIQLLDPSMKDTQFTLDLQNLGIVRAAIQRTEAGSEVIARLDVELYCEAVVFTPSSDAVA